MSEKKDRNAKENSFAGDENPSAGNPEDVAMVSHTVRNLIIFGVVAMAIVGICVLAGNHNQMKLEQYRNVHEIYDEAEMLVLDGQYSEAAELLEGILDKDEDYDDIPIKKLHYLCQACICHNAGKYEEAYDNFIWVGSLKNASDEMQQELAALEDMIYDDYYADMARQTDEKIRNGVPYVGMSESRIRDTSLGSPSSNVKHNYECIGGQQYLANIYNFVENGVTIFTARCVQGRVTEVWDKRDSSGSSSGNSGSSGSSGRSSSGSSSRSSSSYTDPYDIHYYSDPEDFYEDYYDEFEGYDDAEAYWEENW